MNWFMFIGAASSYISAYRNMSSNSSLVIFNPIFVSTSRRSARWISPSLSLSNAVHNRFKPSWSTLLVWSCIIFTNSPPTDCEYANNVWGIHTINYSVPICIKFFHHNCDLLRVSALSERFHHSTKLDYLINSRNYLFVVDTKLLGDECGVLTVNWTVPIFVNKRKGFL